eukprot:2063972-Karenia_brevis.AAC.1
MHPMLRTTRSLVMDILRSATWSFHCHECDRAAANDRLVAFLTNQWSGSAIMDFSLGCGNHANILAQTQ